MGGLIINPDRRRMFRKSNCDGGLYSNGVTQVGSSYSSKYLLADTSMNVSSGKQSRFVESKSTNVATTVMPDRLSTGCCSRRSSYLQKKAALSRYNIGLRLCTNYLYAGCICIVRLIGFLGAALQVPALHHRIREQTPDAVSVELLHSLCELLVTSLCKMKSWSGLKFGWDCSCTAF